MHDILGAAALLNLRTQSVRLFIHIKKRKIYAFSKSITTKNKLRIQNMRNVVWENQWHFGITLYFYKLFQKMWLFQHKVSPLWTKYLDVGSPVLHIFNSTVWFSYIKINERDLHYIYIYIYIYIYTYIYIVIHRQTVSLYYISCVWQDIQDTSSWDENLLNFTSGWWHTPKPAYDLMSAW